MGAAPPFETLAQALAPQGPMVFETLAQALAPQGTEFRFLSRPLAAVSKDDKLRDHSRTPAYLPKVFIVISLS